MKKPYAEVVETIERLAPLWQERMKLGHFEIEHVFLDSLDGEPGDGSDFHTTAVCEVRWNYLEAKIKWYLPSAIRHSSRRIEETLVHELCHVLLACEQALLDTELNKRIADDAMTSSEADVLTDLFYERLEMATEQTARAIWNCWDQAA